MNSDGGRQRELPTLLSAMLDGQMTPAEESRLADLLRDDPNVQQIYLDFCWTHALLRRELGAYRDVSPLPLGKEEESDECEMMNDELQIGPPSSDIHHSSFTTHHSGSPPAAPIPPIIIDTTGSPHTPIFSLTSSVGGWLVSYAAATVLTGMAILGAWAYKVSQDEPLVAATENSRGLIGPGGEATEALPPKPELVGRITGMADCRWADLGSVPHGNAVSLGGKFALASGLMEITYDSGAKVILQGPCTYEVESAASGFLALGKLTARVETKGEGGRGKAEEAGNSKSEVRNPKSPFLLPPSPFIVKTPTAVVTDLGTEFGVEVEKGGQTQARVFRGKVQLRRIDAEGPAGQTAILAAGQTARCGGGPIVVAPASENSTRFVRALPFGQANVTRIVEKFDGPGLGPAFEQMPPGSYAILRGAAVFQQPPARDGRNYRGYIRTVAADFCDRDFIFEATVQVDLRRPSRRTNRIASILASATACPTRTSPTKSRAGCSWTLSSIAAGPSCGCAARARRCPRLSPTTMPTTPTWRQRRLGRAWGRAGTASG